MLGDSALEASWVVANRAMNRERDLAGPNGYGREVGFDMHEELGRRLADNGEVSWLDLCCGQGRALIQAAELLHDAPGEVTLHGVDLVDFFAPIPVERRLTLHFTVASLAEWRPQRRYDLITCVHGLHYIGDKLGLIARAASWLTGDGLFSANLDLANLALEDGSAARRVPRALRAAGFEYARRWLRCRGHREVTLPFEYLGADDGVGPNYTRQPAVCSWYRLEP